MNRSSFVSFSVFALSTLLVACGGSSSSGGGSVSPPPDLSGSIAIETSTRVDGDTADDIRQAAATENDSPANAQSLPPGATLGGYLSANGNRYNNPGGVFLYYRDLTDVYAAQLVSGDRISVQAFGSPDLFLTADTDPPTWQLRVLKAASGGFIEAVPAVMRTADFSPITLTLPNGFESGSYLIEISTSAGMPFRYVLALADIASSSGVNAEYVQPPFILDQAIVRMESPLAPQVLASAMAGTNQTPLGRDTWLMQRAPARVLSTESRPEAGTATIEWVRSLSQQPGVTLAEPNYAYSLQSVSPNNDDFYSRQWALPLINTPMAWQVAHNTGSGVGIAVLDTGLFRSDPNNLSPPNDWHPDFVPASDPASNVQVIPGEIMDYVSGSRDIDGTGGRDTNPADPGDGRTQSSNFHGTHVAGIAAAADNDIGIVGVAPSATIYPVRVLGSGGVGSSADLIAGIAWAAGRSEIDVLNLSLGGLGPSQALKDAIDLAWDSGNGQLIVAAAGNAATDQPTYPAAYSNVVGVGAVDGAGVRAGYSNIGPSVDLVAPGGDASRDANQDGFADVIVSTYGADDNGAFSPNYFSLQGTSMAAPHVAGLYALMKGEVANLSPADFMAYLQAGSLTRDVGPEFEYGAGLIDALAAMDAALEGVLPVTLSSEPSAVQLNAAVLTSQLALTSFPTAEAFNVDSVTATAGWLSATVVKTAADTATVTVTADPGGLDPNQRYLGELIINYDPDNGAADTITVPVSLQLGTALDDRDSGRHYVLLISAEGDNENEVVEQRVVSVVDGRYQYAFETVEPGEYFLVAGTDTDNNGLICESGEACAEYPVNGLPESISLGPSPTSGIVLNTSFRRPTISELGLPRVGFEGYRLKPAERKTERSDVTREYAR